MEFDLSGGTDIDELRPLRLHVCDRVYEVAEAEHSDPFEFEWDSDEYEVFDLGSATTIEVALSKETNSSATGAPVIGGSTIFRRELSVGPGTIGDSNGLENVVYSYQWVRIDGINETEIAGATSETYSLTADDIDKSDQSRCNVHRRCWLSRAKSQ